MIATGDHNNLALLIFWESQGYYKLSVPNDSSCAKRVSWKFHNEHFCWGSHKDIFPTLFHLALSKARYFKSGNNLCKICPPFDFFCTWSDVLHCNRWLRSCAFWQQPKSYNWKDPYVFNNLSTPDFRQILLMKKARSYFASFIITSGSSLNQKEVVFCGIKLIHDPIFTPE